ncbi:MAG: acyltransferase [Planctomycetes bacterium]|jgi:peptidoglycan/LPS O-acetylase OafA/YrhL|nr:acyltransferase [Planctomycetota bacterium]
MPSSEPKPPVHHAGLDGLRAIAVLLVLYGHAPLLLGRQNGNDGGIWHASRGAWIGVDLFFVLSGFLITSILLRARGTDGALRRFWIRRALRIFPLAWLYLLTLVLVAWLVPEFGHLAAPAPLVWAATWLINFHIAAQGWTTAALALLWSLAVEEQFYLGWPLLILRASRTAIAIVVVAMIVLTPVLRMLARPQLGPDAIYVLTFCRWDTLAFGALLALVHDSPWRGHLARLVHWGLLPATATIAWVLAMPVQAVDPDTSAWFQAVGYSAVAAAFAIWCAAALVPGRLARLLANPWLGRIGSISYGLYVWHVLVAELLVRGMHWCGLGGGLILRAVLWLLALWLVASTSYRWFELPLLRCKDRLT